MQSYYIYGSYTEADGTGRKASEISIPIIVCTHAVGI